MGAAPPGVAIPGLGSVQEGQWKAPPAATGSACSAKFSEHHPGATTSASTCPGAAPPRPWTRRPVGAQLRRVWCPDPASQPVVCLGRAFPPCQETRLLVRLAAVATALFLGGGPLVGLRLPCYLSPYGGLASSPIAQQLATPGEREAAVFGAWPLRSTLRTALQHSCQASCHPILNLLPPLPLQASAFPGACGRWWPCTGAP